MENIQSKKITIGATPTVATSGLRELSPDEINLVSGARPEGYLNALVNRGLFSPANIAAASRLAGGLGLVYGSFKVGWSIGSWAYNTGSNAFYGSSPRGK